MDRHGLTEKSTILLVDDTADNLVLMSNLLKDIYKVKIANNGEKALKIAMSDSPPDLILLDIVMPGMDGYELCKRLKNNTKTINIPVIFLTAKSDVKDEEKGLDLGAVDYITKPISPPIVLARVKNHLALKALSDFLIEKNIELESTKSVAVRANLAKSEFISNMSHELRSPLNAILGFAQLMETATPLPSIHQKESITQILKAGWHLLKLINEILDLAVIESGKATLSPESISLSEIMSECKAIMESEAKSGGISMTFPKFEQPSFVKADRTRLKQIVINLLSNAIKYNKRNGSVIVDCTTNNPGRIRINVKDTGMGLAPEKIDQLFQPFNRLGQENGNVAGTGIGLVVTKRLAELMDAVIGVESTIGEGSVFWCELVSTEVPLTEIQSRKTEVPVRPQIPVDGPIRTLLYVEDNPANLDLVEQLIARQPDIRLLTAVNGIQAIEIVRTSRPDVILMDINLPGISGTEVMKILRYNPATAHIPIVAISANAMVRDIQSGLKQGFYRYLTKPIKVNEFMDTLEEAFEHSLEENA